MLLGISCGVSASRGLGIASPAETVSALSLAPREWARRASDNEIKIIRYSSPFLRYRIHQIDLKGDQTREVIESKDGPVARLIERSGKPLTKAQDEAERSRLQQMLNAPDEFAKHMRNELSGKKTAADLLGLMPQSMIYSYAAGQPQRSGRAQPTPEVVLDFRPDAAWKPPTLAADALTGLEGRIWINPNTGVVSRMDARVVRGVNFGWGMLAHVYPGGTITFQQTGLPGNRFIVSHFVEDLTLRAMLVKTFKVHGETTASNFTAVSTMSYQQAIQTLLETPLTTVN